STPRSEGHRARARALALEGRGQGEQAAIGIQGTDELEPDRQAVRCPPARRGEGRGPGEVEGPHVGIPGAANGAGGLAADGDRLEGVVVYRERRTGEGRGHEEIEALEEGMNATIDGRPLAERVPPVHRRPPRTPLDRLPKAPRYLVAVLRHVRADARGQPALEEHQEGLLEDGEVLLHGLD